MARRIFTSKVHFDAVRLASSKNHADCAAVQHKMAGPDGRSSYLTLAVRLAAVARSWPRKAPGIRDLTGEEEGGPENTQSGPVARNQCRECRVQPKRWGQGGPPGRRADEHGDR